MLFGKQIEYQRKGPGKVVEPKFHISNYHIYYSTPAKETFDSDSLGLDESVIAFPNTEFSSIRKWNELPVSQLYSNWFLNLFIPVIADKYRCLRLFHDCRGLMQRGQVASWLGNILVQILTIKETKKLYSLFSILIKGTVDRDIIRYHSFLDF